MNVFSDHYPHKFQAGDAKWLAQIAQNKAARYPLLRRVYVREIPKNERREKVKCIVRIWDPPNETGELYEAAKIKLEVWTRFPAPSVDL